MDVSLCESVPAKLPHEQIGGLGMEHVLTVPDTAQRTLMASLLSDPHITTHTFSTEHEAICCNAGMWMGGFDALVLIQNTGFFAGLNALRGVAIDLRIPTFLLVGQYAHDVSLPVEEDSNTAVRLIKPVLAAMETPFYIIDRPADVGLIGKGYAQSRAERRPVVCLVTAPTA
jgi:sulfopyruvate decarboxylase TPP-binding subunit